MNKTQRFALIGRAISLIQEKPQATSARQRMKWTTEAKALLGQLMPQPKIDTSSEDYQYLQSVIKRELANMNDPDIGGRITEILNKNAESPAFLSYVQQAVASYREAMLAASKQFLWGRA